MHQQSVVIALEGRYPSYNGAVDAAEVVLLGLKWPTEHWVGLALGWLEQGAPISSSILQELKRLGSDTVIAQSLKHRAFVLFRRGVQSLPIEELDVVRVAILHQESRDYYGTESVMRKPRVGDIGTVVHAYPVTSGSALFEVEAVDDDGLTLWVAAFEAAELKLEEKYFDAGA